MDLREVGLNCFGLGKGSSECSNEPSGGITCGVFFLAGWEPVSLSRTLLHSVVVPSSSGLSSARRRHCCPAEISDSTHPDAVFAFQKSWIGRCEVGMPKIPEEGTFLWTVALRLVLSLVFFMNRRAYRTLYLGCLICYRPRLIWIIHKDPVRTAQ
jgi:hypothetical protein